MITKDEKWITYENVVRKRAYSKPGKPAFSFTKPVAAVAEWLRDRIVAGLVASSSTVPLKTRRVGERCTLNLSRVQTSSRWCGVVVRRGGASSGVVTSFDHGSKLSGPSPKALV
ncbi:uncharacterized protein TNCV_3718011 [Trichonephila clavipes]|nr:uncharacterized protein TNCV_3718011 [Trichonephila clavipes]